MYRYLPIACMLIISSCLLRSNSASFIQLQLRNTVSREYAPIAYDAPRLPEAVYPAINRSVRVLYPVGSHSPFVWKLDQPLEDSLVNVEGPELVELPVLPTDNIICCFPPQPQFPGGEDSLRAFLRQHMEYPAEAVAHKKSGTVFVQFTVTESGQTEDYKVLNKPIGYGLEEEALRVMRLMPRWIPGAQNGQSEKTLYQLPVRFSME